MFDIETKFGEIHFSQNIVNSIVVNAVENCDGKVILHNFKGKYMDMMPVLASKMNLYDETSGSIEVIGTEEAFEIKAYTVIKFGTSIKSVTAQIINDIYNNCEKILCKKPDKVTVVVTGTLSKNIAKRNIEVSR